MSEMQKVGCVGDGQLIRMEIEEVRGHNLPADFWVVGTGNPSPAEQVGAHQIRADKDLGLYDMRAIERMADLVDVITWEIEHIPAGFLMQLALRGYNIQPDPTGLHVIQDKLRQKEHFARYHLPVAPFMAIETEDDIIKAQHEFGDIIIKTRKGGYDGRGNLVVRAESPAEILKWAKDKEGKSIPIYAEKKLPFERELAIIIARSKDGEVATYPLVQTIHENNICSIVMAPAPGAEKLQAQADELAREALKTFGGAGVWAFELFDHDSSLLLNEVAPRVHNSGHLTIEANETSQFMQHFRAITGQKLGSTALKVPAAVMINVLGTKNALGEQSKYLLTEEDVVYALMREPGAFIHLYGKAAREDRKVAHATVIDETIEAALKRAHRVRQAIAA